MRKSIRADPAYRRARNGNGGHQWILSPCATPEPWKT